jgi:hypothetical protein
MDLPRSATRLIDDFLDARKAIKAKEPNQDKAWAATYGPNGLWEPCIAAVAEFGVTREQAIQYIYTERQQGRAV